MYMYVYIFICTHHLCRPWSLCLVVLDHISFLLAKCESLLVSSGHEKYQRSISSQLRMGMWLSSKGIAYTSNTPNWHISTPTGLFLNMFHVSLKIDYSHNTRTSCSIVRGNTARLARLLWALSVLVPRRYATRTHVAVVQNSEALRTSWFNCGSIVGTTIRTSWFNNHQMFNQLFIILTDHSSTMVQYTVRTC